MSDYETIEAYISSMLHTIAMNNAEFVCGCCLTLKDDLLRMAHELLGADRAEQMHDEYLELVKEYSGEED